MPAYLGNAYNLSRWLLGNPRDAEEAVKDACRRTIRAFSGFRVSEGRAWFLPKTPF
jgi:RNA polymerase sigma-70 factor (ECF subfamily)